MILAIKTDAPTVELLLVDADGSIVRKDVWVAERRLALELMERLGALLQSMECSWEQVDGLVVYKGPGSFTGLRIGVSVINTIAYAQNIPVIGQSEETWLEDGLSRMRKGENDRVVVPEYGAAARITQPRK